MMLFASGAYLTHKCQASTSSRARVRRAMNLGNSSLTSSRGVAVFGPFRFCLNVLNVLSRVATRLVPHTNVGQPSPLRSATSRSFVLILIFIYSAVVRVRLPSHTQMWEGTLLAGTRPRLAPHSDVEQPSPRAAW